MGQKETVTAKWLDNLAFESEINGHKLLLDASPSVGGDNRGPRPKNLLLAALGSCTGIDVVSILKKMRVELDGLEVTVEGDQTEEHPRHFYRMHIIYEFTGKDLPMDKLQKAISMSEEKYCSVRAVFKKAMEISSEIRIKNS